MINKTMNPKEKQEEWRLTHLSTFLTILTNYVAKIPYKLGFRR